MALPRSPDSPAGRFLALVWSGLCIACSLHATLVRAAEYHVPSGPTPTLQSAINAALLSGDPLETIYIEANLDVNVETTIPFGFDAGHKLLIRPGTTRPRAIIRMLNCCDPVLRATTTSYVTIQDLDIFRHITNNDHIIVYDLCSDMLIQRCRIGSDWPTPGVANWSAIHWTYPFNSMIRNTMTFATSPSTWQYGISITSHDDPGSRLWLYNNSMQGFYGAGLSLQGADGKVMIRNNVAVTDAAINPDPVGYAGNIGPGLILASSHNAVFCDPGDEWSGADDIRGGNFARLNFVDIPTSFVSSAWAFDSPNPNFLEIERDGPLHTSARLGVNLPGGMPDPDDQQVRDDWEREPRPSGSPPHTDRGADQSDLEAPTSMVESNSPGTSLPGVGITFDLTVRPVPAHGSVRILLDAGTHSGAATIRLLDSSGRLLREVWSGQVQGSRIVSWEDHELPAGVYYLAAEMSGGVRTRKLVLTR